MTATALAPRTSPAARAQRGAPARRSVRRLARRSVRRWARARPELPLWAVAGGAWAATAVLHLRPGNGHVDHAGGLTPGGLAAALAAWLVMVLAMMVPFALPEARWLTWRSLRSRRGRVLAAFAVGVCAPWAALGAALVPVATAVDPAVRPLVGAGLLVGAAGWHCSPRRVAAVHRCGSLPVPAVRGWRADRSCLRAGVVRGRRCVTTCAPAMAAMAFAPGLALMAALTAVQWSEQGRGPDPHRRGARPSHAAAVLGLAALVAIVG